MEDHGELGDRPAPDEALRELRRKLRDKKYVRRLKALQAIEEDRQAEQDKAAKEFRSVLRLQGLLPSEYDDFGNLLRFLKVSGFDIPLAVKKWSTFLQWKDDNDIDNILSYEYPEQEAVNRAFTGTHHGVDRKGRPVSYELPGRYDSAELLRVTTFDRYIRYKLKDILTTINVRLPACSVAAGRRVYGDIAVLDAHSVGWKNATKETFDLLRAFSKFDSDYLPELCQQMIVINANSFLKNMWSTIKVLFRAETMEKFIILGTDYHKELFELIDPSQVPAMLGGTCHCTCSGGCMNADLGPWKDPRIMRAVHLMRRGELDVSDPMDFSNLNLLGRIRWQSGEFKLDGDIVPGAEECERLEGIEAQEEEEEVEEEEMEEGTRGETEEVAEEEVGECEGEHAVGAVRLQSAAAVLANGRVSAHGGCEQQQQQEQEQQQQQEQQQRCSSHLSHISLLLQPRLLADSATAKDLLSQQVAVLKGLLPDHWAVSAVIPILLWSFAAAAHLWHVMLAVIIALFQLLMRVVACKLRLLTFPQTRRLLRSTVALLLPQGVVMPAQAVGSSCCQSFSAIHDSDHRSTDSDSSSGSSSNEGGWNDGRYGSSSEQGDSSSSSYGGTDTRVSRNSTPLSSPSSLSRTSSQGTASQHSSHHATPTTPCGAHPSTPSPLQEQTGRELPPPTPSNAPTPSKAQPSDQQLVMPQFPAFSDFFSLLFSPPVAVGGCNLPDEQQQQLEQSTSPMLTRTVQQPTMEIQSSPSLASPLILSPPSQPPPTVLSQAGPQGATSASYSSQTTLTDTAGDGVPCATAAVSPEAFDNAGLQSSALSCNYNHTPNDDDTPCQSAAATGVMSPFSLFDLLSATSSTLLSFTLSPPAAAVTNAPSTSLAITTSTSLQQLDVSPSHPSASPVVPFSSPQQPEFGSSTQQLVGRRGSDIGLDRRPEGRKYDISSRATMGVNIRSPSWQSPGTFKHY